jgi:predicted nucleotidyltransferase
MRASLVGMGTLRGNEKETLASWAAAIPRIRRVWLFGGDAKRNQRANTDLDVAIEMEPVADSEETISVWIAHAEQWQNELESRIGAAVDLEWFDPDVDAPLSEKAILAYDRMGRTEAPRADSPPRRG